MPNAMSATSAFASEGVRNDRVNPRTEASSSLTTVSEELESISLSGVPSSVSTGEPYSRGAGLRQGHRSCKAPTVTKNGNAPLLANSALFVDLAPKALEFLAERATRLEFERGRHIFRQGDEGDTLFVIAEGLVKVWVSSGEGGEMVLATL